MMDRENRKYSDEWFVELYLKYGSVEEALRRHDDILPISVANYHRLVKRYGLVKSPGRHVSLPETLHFFREKAFAKDEPLERVYRNMPPTFQTSLSTLHRMYQFMERQVVRRWAAALLITDEQSGNILVGNEVFANSRYGKKVGDISVPMGFAKEDESDFDSALRVLQQEVFAKEASNGELGKKSSLTNLILPDGVVPMMYFDIVDVRVKVFSLSLPKFRPEFSSFKLVNHKFENPYVVSEDLSVRAGVDEIAKLYVNYCHTPEAIASPAHYVSHINEAALAYSSKLA